MALAIAGPRTLAQVHADELVRRLGGAASRWSGIAPRPCPLPARQRALAAGVREIHDRPTEWRPYSALIDSLVARFTPAGLPPR